MNKISFDFCQDFLKFSQDEQLSDNNQTLSKLKNIIRLIIKNDLSSRQKEVCYFYYYKSLSFTQIANVLNLHKSTISRTHKRALNKINQMLKYHNVR